MIFLNPWFLSGIGLIAIPVLIHMFSRKSARIVEWGAMRFLVNSMISRKRRILFEEILLMAVRCLVVSLPALAMARPFAPPDAHVPWLFVLPVTLFAIMLFGVSFAVWRYPRWRICLLVASLAMIVLAFVATGIEKWLGMKRSGGDGRRDIAIVIDGSMSMTIKVNGKSNFDRAIEEAVQLVETSDGDKSFSLVLGGPAASVRIPSPVSSRDDVLAALDSLTPLNGGLSVLDVLSSALMTLARGANPEKQIVLFTDSQKTGWETDSPAHWRMFARNMSFFAVRPVLMARVFDLPDEYRNIAVGEMSISRSVVGTDREVGIDVRIENTGREAVTPARLTLLSGGTEAGVYIPGQILPGASEQAHFRHRFKESGANRLSAVLECEDDLMCDNTRHLAVNVARNINVLLIDGNPSARFIERSAGFASLALAPGNDMLFQGGETGEGDHRFLVHPVIVDAVDAVSITNLDEYAVVVLADVPRLPSGFSAVLANYIRDGGGLLVAPGARALPAFYNSWKTGSGIPVTPAYMLERIACGTNGLSATPSTSTFTHSVLKDVASGMRSDMGTTSLDAYWKLQEEPADHSVAVGGRLNTGDIFACERNLGRGRVIMTSFPLDARAGNLATRQSFVPLMHGIIYHLANPGRISLDLLPEPEFILRLSSDVPGAAGRSGRGLQAEYFSDPGFAHRILSRVDDVLDTSSCGPVPPAAGSARWTGSIIPLQDGNYALSSDSNGRVNLWIDGQQVIRDGGAGQVFMKARRRHDIRMEVSSAPAPVRASLSWASRSQAREVVPGDRLSVTPGTWFLNKSAGDIMVKCPDGAGRPAQITYMEDGIVLNIESDMLPGAYDFAVPQGIRGFLGGALSRTGEICFTVRASSDEGNLEERTGLDAEMIRGYVPFNEAESFEGLDELMSGQVAGSELWGHLILALLVLLLAEILLTRWIAVERETGMEKDVEFEEKMQPPTSFREQLEKLRGGSA